MQDEVEGQRNALEAAPSAVLTENPTAKQQTLDDVVGILRTPLFRDRILPASRDREQPNHRLAVVLKAQGYSNKEIATMLDLCPVTIGQVLRQPWARELLLELVATAGAVGVGKLLRSELVPSIMTLAEVRDDCTAPSSARVNASNILMQQYLGKPLQRSENVIVDGGSVPQDVGALQRKLDELKAEETRLKSN